MKSKSNTKHGILPLVLLLIAGIYCTGRPAAAQERDFVIRPGDILSIEVMEHPEFNRANILVLPDGYIQYPALGNLKVSGKSPGSLADTLQQVLDGDYVINPLVTVYVNHIYNESVNVFGAVNSPGRYQLFEPMEIMMVLGMAGGLTDIRHFREVLIMRKDGTVEKYNLKKIVKRDKLGELQQVIIYPEDTIVVEENRVNWSQLSFIATLSYTLLRLIEIFVF